MALPDFSMRQLLEAGVHFGHQTHRWNPKMDKFIFGKRNNIHILDLSQTVPLLHTALKQISDTVAKGGRVLCRALSAIHRRRVRVLAAIPDPLGDLYRHRWDVPLRLWPQLKLDHVPVQGRCAGLGRTPGRRVHDRRGGTPGLEVHL